VPFYIDTSAFLKLLVAEAETPAMRAWFGASPACWSSHLLVTEALRAAARLGLNRHVVDETLDAVSLILPAATTFYYAAALQPTALRSLDALHLATAMELGDDLDGIVSYDARLVAGARAAGLPVVTPT
jgi:predicted nucleic acid-binding protein